MHFSPFTSVKGALNVKQYKYVFLGNIIGFSFFPKEESKVSGNYAFLFRLFLSGVGFGSRSKILISSLFLLKFEGNCRMATYLGEKSLHTILHFR